MSLLVYGIAETGEAGLEVSGLDDRPLHEVAEDRLAAIVGDHDGDRDPPAATIGTLRAYEDTVEQLMEARVMLPARFGSVMADEGAVRGMLRRRRADLLARLDRVRGAVELGLRAVWREPGDAAPGQRSGSGTEYLRARMDRRRRATDVADHLDRLMDVAHSCRRALLPRPELPVLDAYLVDRARVDEFVALVRDIDRQIEDVELLCTGPWPPYSFAEGAPV